MTGLLALGRARSPDDPAGRMNGAANGVAGPDRALRVSRATLGEVLARESPPASPAERLLLAEVAYEAVRDGSRRHEEASALARRALVGAPALRFGEADARAFSLACVALCCCDSFVALDAALDEAIGSAGENGSASFTARARLSRAHSRLRQGRLVEAIEDLDRLESLARRLGPEAALRIAGLRALCVLERDGPEAARAALARGRQGQHAQPGSLWLLAHARTAAANGDLERALADLNECGERQLRAGAPNPAQLWWRSDASEVALRLGRRERALALAHEELELARLFGSPRALGIALRAAGAASGEGRGRELLVESVAVLRDSGARLELARTLVELGALVRRSGERRDARYALRAGCDLAERLGATRLAAHAREELTATGARPRRDRLSGADALTPSERRTAQLAARGMSNREIASTLFVTVRTVTTHLTHVYQKLEVEGRGNLAEVLAAATGEPPPAEVDSTAAPPPPPRRAPRAPEPPAGEPGPQPSLAARWEQLSEAALTLARSAAVLGPVQASRCVGPLSRLGQDEVEQAARELTRAGILCARELRFADPRIEDAVYAAIPPRERSQAHGDAARLLAVQRAAGDEIAEHLLRVEPAGDDEVIVLLRAAARHALGQGAPERAVRYLRRALAEPPDEDDVASVTAELGSAETMFGDPAAVEHLARALSLASEPNMRADTASELAGALYWAGRFEESHAVAGEAIGQLGDDADPELVSRLESTRVCVELIDSRFAGRLAERMPYLRMISVAAEVGGQALLVLEGFWRWQHRLAGMNPRALVDRGIESGRFPDLEGATGPFTAFPIAMLVFADEIERADRLVERILAFARQSGSVPAEILALGWRSQVALRAGYAARADQDARAAVELTRGPHLGAGALVAHCFHAEALAERGRLADAVRTIESVSLSGLRCSAIEAYALFVRGRLRLAQGRPVDAGRDLRACGAASKALFTDNPEVCPWRSALALTLARGEHDEALELARSELALARRRRHTRAIAVALRACGLLEGGEAGIELLRQAVAGLASTSARLEHARALTDLGVALRDAGQPAQARERLREGLSMALTAGAIALADRAVRELAATGGPPAGGLLAGPSSFKRS